MTVPRLLAPFVLFLALAVAAWVPAAGQDFRVLVFSKTAGFRHDSIPAGIALIQSLGAAHGFSVEVSENADVFTFQSLGLYTEVWIQQISTGSTKYYLLPALAQNSGTLPGLVDRTGFRP
jgi:hypothetical protein